MNPNLRRLLSLALVAASACGGGAVESPGRATSAITVTGSGFVNQGGLDLALSLVEFRKSSFTFAGGVATLTPSPALSLAIWQDPDASKHALSVTPQPVSFDPGGILPTITASLTAASLDMNAVSLQFGASELDVDADINGAIHVHAPTPWPDADLKVDHMNVRIVLKFDTGQQLLVATVPPVNIASHVENCGIFGWCDDLLHHNLPDMGSKVASLIQDELNKQLADPRVTQTLYRVFGTVWNGLHQADFGGGPPWAAVPGTLTITDFAFRFAVQRSFAPGVAPDCQVVGATGAVVFYCKPYPAMHSGTGVTETAPVLYAQYWDGLTWIDLGAIAHPDYGSATVPVGSHDLRLQWRDSDGAGPWSSTYTAIVAGKQACDAACFQMCDTTTFEGCVCPPCKSVCPYCGPPNELIWFPDGSCSCQPPPL